MTEKVKRYMDFMGPASAVPRKTSGDPLANRPVSRTRTSVKAFSKAPIKNSPKPSPRQSSTAKPASSARPASVAKPASAPKTPQKTASPAKDADSLALKAAAALSGTNLTPDLKAAQYTLNGKSPFLSSYNIEKRPLSDSVKEKKVEEIPKKNVYEKPKKTEKPEKSEKSPVVVIDQPKNFSGLSLVIIIILTIILGAAVGAGAYFLLPK